MRHNDAVSLIFINTLSGTSTTATRQAQNQQDGTNLWLPARPPSLASLACPPDESNALRHLFRIYTPAQLFTIMGGGNDHAEDSMDADQASGSSKPPVPAVTSGDDDDDEEVDEEQIEEYQEMLEGLGAHPVRYLFLLLF